MAKKPEMNPEILQDGVAVCQQKCEAFSKETKEKDGSVEATVKCALRVGKDREVHPRPVCSPWSNHLLVANQRLSEAVTRLTEAAKRTANDVADKMGRLRLEASHMEKTGVDIRSKLVRAKKDLEIKGEQIIGLVDDFESEKLKRREAWGELKKVQNFRKGKKRHEERLVKALEKVEALTSKITSLEASNKRLIREDVSKSGIIKTLEERIGALMSARDKLPKPPQAETPPAEEAAPANTQ